jgi:glycosyltransferase involved in cell wall biosynthesis
MLCGCPVVASDKVGAVRDLIVPGRTGLVYPCGDTQALASVLKEALGDPERLAAMSGAAHARIESWSPRASVTALVDAVERGVAHAVGRPLHPSIRPDAQPTVPTSPGGAPQKLSE